MPAFIKVDYEIPKRKQDEDTEKYLLRIIYDVKHSLRELNSLGEFSLYTTLEIINAGSYISKDFQIQIPYKISFLEVKNLIKAYERRYKKTIEDLIEDSGQWIVSEGILK